MTKLDRYVGKIVLGAFLAALSFFMLITIMVDLLTSLPRYAERAAAAGMGGLELSADLGLRYLKMLPVVMTTVTPFAAVVAGMFSVARLHNANEIVPMLFVGRSIHRVLRPMLWCGVIAGMMMVVSWQWIVPHVGADLAASNSFLRESTSVQTGIVHEKHEEESQYFYAMKFDPDEQTLAGAQLLVYGDMQADAVMISAETASWDKERGDWLLQNGRRTTQAGGGPIEWLGRPDLTPGILMQNSRDSVDPATMSYTELQSLIEERPNRNDLRLAFHRHITYPLANLLLLLLALPLAIRYERGTRIARIMAAIALCGGYMLTDLVCQKLGQQQGMLHPIVAAWTPTILFGSLGIVMFSSTRS